MTIKKEKSFIPQSDLFVPSVGATGGVYKGQGRNRSNMLKYSY